ncbi:ion channel [Bradyrhizobium sp. LB11.1]|uniref:ion channel n=1 Tax=Bradyrhizobium sp. LB11.1 TaxID=3156326 RepID=UPI0033957D42
MGTLIEVVIALIGLAFLAFVGWLASSPGTSILALIFIAALWAFILLLALLAAIAIFAPEYKERVSFQLPKILAKFNPSKLHTLGYVALSYALTIYLFAVIFRATTNFDKAAFNPAIDSVWTGMYFSIVTIATVGYGDILPVSSFARLMVSIEILSGVAYGVFFLSIIASFLRED